MLTESLYSVVFPSEERSNSPVLDPHLFVGFSIYVDLGRQIPPGRMAGVLIFVLWPLVPRDRSRPVFVVVVEERLLVSVSSLPPSSLGCPVVELRPYPLVLLLHLGTKRGGANCVSGECVSGERGGDVGPSLLLIISRGT